MVAVSTPLALPVFISTYLAFQGASELDLHPDRMGIDKLRTLLVSTAKESAFRKVVQATMVRDRQHGPVLELNREGEATKCFTSLRLCPRNSKRKKHPASLSISALLMES